MTTLRSVRCTWHLFPARKSDLFLDSGAKSEESIALRKQVADACEDAIQRFFDGGGQVVVYDANNGVKANRTRLAEKFDELGIHVVFLGIVV